MQEIERAGTHVLTVNEADIGYVDKVLARDISLILRRGECLGVIGPNGSGKTTFVRTILNTIPALAGDVRWGANRRKVRLYPRLVLGRFAWSKRDSRR